MMKPTALSLLITLTALAACEDDNNSTQANHTEVLTVRHTEPPGENCASGGWMIGTGHDANTDGELSSDEVTLVQFQCILSDETTEPAGEICKYGGTRTDTGLDSNLNNQLDTDEIEASEYQCESGPEASSLNLSIEPIKRFQFSWQDAEEASHYQLLENADGQSGYTPLATIAQGLQNYTHYVPLHDRVNALYILQTCFDNECFDSPPVEVDDRLTQGIGYIKASNAEAYDLFANQISISSDGNTLAVGAVEEDSSATGINNDEKNNDAPESGAVYVFTKSDSGWIQEAYIKASNAEANDQFGYVLDLSSDGNLLAISAPGEDSNARGWNGDATNNDDIDSGAVYVYTRDDGQWEEHAYIKADSNDIRTFRDDNFGQTLSISGDGTTLAIGTPWDSNQATGVQTGSIALDNSAQSSGAVYIYVQNGREWQQQAYLKASNAEVQDQFGLAIDISHDGNTLAIGAPEEDSSTIGINGQQANNDTQGAGAVYLFERIGVEWAQTHYIKSSNTDAGDQFGDSVSLSGNGQLLAIAAHLEDSDSNTINHGQHDNRKRNAGAVYVFEQADNTWAQQAYIKASGTDSNDWFGSRIALSHDGLSLLISATGEASNAQGIDGDPTDNSFNAAGAVYLFRFDAGTWIESHYLKARNTDDMDRFGQAIDISGTGETIAAGTPAERSNAQGINGDAENNALTAAGAVYLY